MTFKSRLPLHIYQKYFQTKDHIDSFTSKLEVIADSTAILYSVRILIIVIALLMGYVQSSQDKTELPTTHKKEISSNNSSEIYLQ